MQYLKSISAKLCPPVSGQAVLDVIVTPPQPEEPSYQQFMMEKSHVLSQLKEKACILKPFLYLKLTFLSNLIPNND